MVFDDSIFMRYRSITIGTGPGCDIQFNSSRKCSRLSPRHATIFYDEVQYLQFTALHAIILIKVIILIFFFLCRLQKCTNCSIIPNLAPKSTVNYIHVILLNIHNYLITVRPIQMEFMKLYEVLLIKNVV